MFAVVATSLLKPRATPDSLRRAGRAALSQEPSGGTGGTAGIRTAPRSEVLEGIRKSQDSELEEQLHTAVTEETCELQPLAGRLLCPVGTQPAPKGFL